MGQDLGGLMFKHGLGSLLRTWLLGVPAVPLVVCGLPLVPDMCPSCEETRILPPPSMPS